MKVIVIKSTIIYGNVAAEKAIVENFSKVDPTKAKILKRKCPRCNFLFNIPLMVKESDIELINEIIRIMTLELNDLRKQKQKLKEVVKNLMGDRSPSFIFNEYKERG